MNSSETPNCLFCNQGATRQSDQNFHGHYVCRRCGRYTASEQFQLSGVLNDFADQLYLISGHTRERTDRRAPDHSGPAETVFRNDEDVRDMIRDIIENAPKRIPEKADKLLEALIRRTDQFGQAVSLNPQDDYPLGYAKNDQELKAFIGYLKERGYLQDAPDENMHDAYRYIVSASGHERAEQREESNAESSLVFVAMWFDGEMSDAWENGIKAAVERVGYDARRVDLEEYNDDVIDRMIALIKESRFIVADFTGHRNGVYFEAGFARGLSVPVVWCCRKDQIDRAHFDTNHFSHIVWSDANELKEKLENRILATIGRGPLKT